MKLKHLALAGAVFGSAMAVAGPAAAQKPDAQVVTVQVCNNTNFDARVALTYEPVGSRQFYNEGWFGVPAHGCQNLVETDNSYIYAYAEVDDDGSRTWAGDHGQCVRYPGPYAFWSSDTQYCDGAQESRNFVVLHADDFGVFTWNLNP